MTSSRLTTGTAAREVLKMKERYMNNHIRTYMYIIMYVPCRKKTHDIWTCTYMHILYTCMYMYVYHNNIIQSAQPQWQISTLIYFTYMYI